MVSGAIKDAASRWTEQFTFLNWDATLFMMNQNQGLKQYGYL
jgi:hypothetical protein